MEFIVQEPATTTNGELETLLPLDSTEAIEWVWTCWRILDMHPSERHHPLYWVYSFFVNVGFSILFPLHLAANLFYKTDFDGVIDNLSVTIPVFCSTIKQYVIFYYIRRNLWPIHEHLKVLDKRAAEHSEEHQIVAREVRFCRRMFISIAITYGVGVFMYAISGLVRHQLPIDSWVPFDYTSSTSLYSMAYAVQMVFISMLVVAQLSNDVYCLSYLALLVAHVQALNVRIARIGNDSSRNVDENNKELEKCVSDHKVCTTGFELLSPVVSGTIFAQYLITGIALCIICVSFLISDVSLTQQASYLVYIICVTIEILPCCWFADELNVESHKLTTALYQSRWYEQDHRFRRTLIIFMQRSQKGYIILAGNLAPVTVSTVRRIIQFSFSMFTVINRVK